MQPFISVTGGPFDPIGKFERVSITDQSGFENDRLEVVLENTTGSVTLPTPGTALRPTFGYRGGALVSPGSFFVDEIEFSGPPDIVSIYAHASDMGKGQKSAKTRDWHEKTIGDIAQQIASDNGMSAVVDSEIGSVTIKHRDQTHQSDQAFLSKLVAEHNGTMKIANQQILILTRNKPRPLLTVGRNQIVSYQGIASRRSEYDGVTGRWHDYQNGREEEVVAGSKGERVFALKETHATQEEAQAAAEAKLTALRREGETFSFSCLGNPALHAESYVRVLGPFPQIRPFWTIERVVHVFGGGGYICNVECVSPDEKEKQAQGSTETGEA